MHSVSKLSSVSWLSSEKATSMVYSSYKQQRILYYYSRRIRSSTIVKLLREEKMTASKNGVSKLIKKYVETGSLGRRPGSGRPTKITPAILTIMEDQMQRDDETMAVQLQHMGHSISLQQKFRNDPLRF